MSESASKARPTAEDEGELDAIADELYALRPDAFAAARDDQVRKARGEGRQPLARELSRLRRPTQSAWLVNLLWREHRDLMQQLLQLASDLGRAQAEASGPELHRLTARRRELDTALMRAVRSLAEKAGGNLSASAEREVQETLAAALARGDVADEIRSGRLVKPAAYAGFGTVLPPVGVRQDAAVQQAASQTEPAPPPAAEPKPDQHEQRAAEQARAQREHLARRVQAARADFEAAADALAERGRVAEAAHQHQRAVRDQLKHLQQELRAVQQSVAAAEQAASAAAERRNEAEKAYDTARRTLARAEQELQASRPAD